ncbi:hypothetical protein N7535_003502 [Penicillium sp. DV-2018c]|nr:hypothetical protein N7461_000795 [Penicillium sp. DV-2018c]KAJ5576576.1 hypothetical protein N7535_003502 [Penicillium sp. DV-2018c]
MRYSVISSLLLLAVSPLAVGLPVDPNDQTGQWDPSGQYRKGHWQNGQFIPNNPDDRYYQNGNLGRTGQWRDNNRNGANGWTDANGQWHVSNQNQNGGWTDANGQWHSNNQNDRNGWTDANGQWHANNQNDQNGWTDSNGQWHANQKRQAPLPGQLLPTGTQKGSLNAAPVGLGNKANLANAIPPITPTTLHRRSWRDAGDYQNNDYNRDDYYNRDDNYNRDGCHRDDRNCRNRNYYNDDNERCRGVWDGRNCRLRDFWPLPTIIPRTWPNDNNNWNSPSNAQVTPSSQNNRYQSYGDYKNYGSYQNYRVNGQDQAQNKDLKATTGQQE